MADKEKCNSSVNKLAIALTVVIVYNLLLTAVVSYAGYCVMNKFNRLEQTNDILQQEVEMLKLTQNKEQADHLSEKIFNNKDKREIISSSVQVPNWLKNIAAGPQGPPGKDGAPGVHGLPGKDGIPGVNGIPGKDGRDGRDSTSLAAIEKVINVTVEKVVLKEWTTFSSKLPTYGGATYVRWGRTVCPVTSKLIYKGQMAGPPFNVVGGGVNYQCLPDDPEYESEGLSAVYSDLVHTRYGYHKGKFDGHMIPCAVCESEKRVTKLMIPGKVQCPTTEWVLEYKGYLFSSVTQYSDGKPVTNEHFRTTYECVDDDEESLTGHVRSSGQGALLFRVKARCSGTGALTHSCPPYQADKPLSCVVCSK